MGALRPDRLIEGNGTPEHEWQAWMERHPLPVLSVDEFISRTHTVHIVAPHPDDEVLSCAGLIQQLGKRGINVQVWAVTDGEASHEASCERPSAQLAEIRTQESLRALSMLHPDILRDRLGIPDGGVSQAQTQLEIQLRKRFNQGDTVIAPWHLDGHPDHEAASRASHAAARQQGCQFLEVPIWGWHWAQPDEPRFPAQRAFQIELTPLEQHLKSRAIQQFQSQLLPDPVSGKAAILPDFALARLERPYEVLFR